MCQNQFLFSDNETAIAPRILHTAGLKMRILSLDYLHLGTQSLAHCDSKQCIGSETMLSQPGQPPESHEQCLLYDCSLLLKDKRKKKGKETHSSWLPETVSLLRSSFSLEGATSRASVKADAPSEEESNGSWRVKCSLAFPNCRSDTEVLVEILFCWRSD